MESFEFVKLLGVRGREVEGKGGERRGEGRRKTV